jgi:hypothetical protein
MTPHGFRAMARTILDERLRIWPHNAACNPRLLEFKRPALSDITSEALFSEKDVEIMNSALAASGRYDFELSSIIRDTSGEIVAAATGCYAVRTMDATT